MPLNSAATVQDFWRHAPEVRLNRSAVRQGCAADPVLVPQVLQVWHDLDEIWGGVGLGGISDMSAAWPKQSGISWPPRKLTLDGSLDLHLMTMTM